MTLFLVAILAFAGLVAARPRAEPHFNAVCGESMYPDAGGYKYGQFIVGGQAARQGEFPWQVSITSRSGSHFCGGVLLDNYFVVTAAHCLEGSSASGTRVVVGQHKRSSTDNRQTTHTVSRLIMHENYDNWNLANDIGLIRLSSPVTFTQYVTPICAPPANELFAGRTCTVSGWGTTSEGGTSADTLRYVNVEILTNDVCRKAYSDYNFYDHYICAGDLANGGKDACQGDSGGPLVCRNTNGKFELAGLVSWGDGCARAGKPGVNTRVSSFLDWIAKQRSLYRVIPTLI